jgi:hypothetical protein
MALMARTFDNLVMNDLEEFSFIGGTQQELYFYLYDEDGLPIDLAAGGTTPSWRLSPYGNSDYAILNIAGSIVTSSGDINLFRVRISSSSTYDLSGKFTQQPVIVDFDGSEYRPSQGNITIISRIETTT